MPFRTALQGLPSSLTRLNMCWLSSTATMYDLPEHRWTYPLGAGVMPAAGKDCMTWHIAHYHAESARLSQPGSLAVSQADCQKCAFPVRLLQGHCTSSGASTLQAGRSRQSFGEHLLLVGTATDVGRLLALYTTCFAIQHVHFMQSATLRRIPTYAGSIWCRSEEPCAQPGFRG